MNDSENTFQLLSIIEEQAECIKQLSDLAHDTLSLLAQYQSVDAEEQKLEKIISLK